MHRLTVGLGERSYDIAIGAGALSEAGTHLAPFCPNGRAIIVTDENVARHWLAPLAASLESAGITAEPIVLPPGEATKSWAELERLVERLLDLDIAREESLIALGGGVIGDIAGFAAGIVKRGCGLVQ
ncbi:MAG: iron-containing alcohol dehydrogenase, partial [Parasphingopyxis sp.]